MTPSKRNPLFARSFQLVALALGFAPACAQSAARPMPPNLPPADSQLGAVTSSLGSTDANTASTLPAPAVKLDAQGKTDVYFHRVLSFGTILGPAFEAGTDMAFPPKEYPEEWRQGAGAYGRNFAAVLGRVQTAEFSRYVTGIALREDPRYYPSKSRNWAGRFAHAIGFTLVDRSDSGASRFAFANLIGATAGGFVENAYLPGSYTDLGHTGVRIGVQMGGFAGVNLLQEFTPDMNRWTQALAKSFHRGN